MGLEPMEPRAKVLSNWSEGSKEALGVAGGFEPAHGALALACWLVRILCAVVQPSVLAMFHVRQYLAFRCSITAELIGYQHTWHVLTALQQLPKELECGSFVAPALEEDIEHIAMLIDCTPQVMQLSID